MRLLFIRNTGLFCSAAARTHTLIKFGGARQRTSCTVKWRKSPRDTSGWWKVEPEEGTMHTVVIRVALARINKDLWFPVFLQWPETFTRICVGCRAARPTVVRSSYSSSRLLRQSCGCCRWPLVHYRADIMGCCHIWFGPMKKRRSLTSDYNGADEMLLLLFLECWLTTHFFWTYGEVFHNLLNFKLSVAFFKQLFSCYIIQSYINSFNEKNVYCFNFCNILQCT